MRTMKCNLENIMFNTLMERKTIGTFCTLLLNHKTWTQVINKTICEGESQVLAMTTWSLLWFMFVIMCVYCYDIKKNWHLPAGLSILNWFLYLRRIRSYKCSLQLYSHFKTTIGRRFLRQKWDYSGDSHYFGRYRPRYWLAILGKYVRPTIGFSVN